MSVVADATSVVDGDYVQRGALRVLTSPELPVTIFVDGLPRDDWGMWTHLPAGSYDVCFGDVAGYVTPGCEAVAVTAGVNTPVSGAFTPTP